MRQTFARNGFKLQERQLLTYNWNTGRLMGETAHYTDGVDDPVDVVMHAGAASVHLLTGIGESIVGDAARLLQGSENRIELEGYRGDLPRLKLDAREAMASVRNVFHGKFASILTLPIIAVKSLGDAAADGVDLLAGIHHDSLATAA